MKCCHRVSPDSQGANGHLNKDLSPKRKNCKVHLSSTKCTVTPSRKNCQKPGKRRSSVIASNKDSIQSQTVTSEPILLNSPIKKAEQKRRASSPITKKESCKTKSSKRAKKNHNLTVDVPKRQSVRIWMKENPEDVATTSNKYASIQVEERQHSTSKAEGVSTTPSDEPSIKEECLTPKSFQKTTTPSDDDEHPTAAPTHTRIFHNVQEMTNNIQLSEDVQPQALHVGIIPQSSSQEEEVIYSTKVEQACSTTHVPNPINLRRPIAETSNRLHINNQNIKRKHPSRLSFSQLQEYPGQFYGLQCQDWSKSRLLRLYNRLHEKHLQSNGGEPTTQRRKGNPSASQALEPSSVPSQRQRPKRARQASIPGSDPDFPQLSFVYSPLVPNDPSSQEPISTTPFDSPEASAKGFSTNKRKCNDWPEDQIVLSSCVPPPRRRHESASQKLKGKKHQHNTFESRFVYDTNTIPLPFDNTNQNHLLHKIPNAMLHATISTEDDEQLGGKRRRPSSVSPSGRPFKQGHTEGHQSSTPRRRQDRRVAKRQQSYPHQQDCFDPQSFSRANVNTDPISDNNNSVPLHTTTYTEYHDLDNVNVLSDRDLDGACFPEDPNLDFTNFDSGQDLDGPNLNPVPVLNGANLTSDNIQRKQPDSTLLPPPPSASAEPSDFLQPRQKRHDTRTQRSQRHQQKQGNTGEQSSSRVHVQKPLIFESSIIRNVVPAATKAIYLEQCFFYKKKRMCVDSPPQFSECTKRACPQPDSYSHPNLRRSSRPQHTQKSARTKIHFNLSFFESPTIQQEHAESVPSNSNSRHWQPDIEEWRSSVPP
ncbi:hypothetical protein O181_026776 [Austropuccinia psidii MF-1]|uniref:Uncharacterized protein n=1 Tax=Austropuccinia psidii MF-1 TaxID=1389203 RepID=A0A9Q3H0T8_9BASI|nr:hypothetical protein [Austropuccinia psidii MF-1]